MKFPAPIRLATFVLMLVGIVLSAPATAQKLGPDGAPNPTASVIDQQTLLKQVPRVEGRIDIPDTKAAVLIQPAESGEPPLASDDVNGFLDALRQELEKAIANNERIQIR